MSQLPQNPVTDQSTKDDHKAALRSAYLVFIRAYLRRNNLPTSQGSGQVKHG